MTSNNFTNDQNTMPSYLRLHVHINDQNTNQRKYLKLPYLHCCTSNICEILRAET